MDLALALALLAGAMHVIAFIIYNQQMFKGTSSPNAATWTLWAILTVFNVASYRAMSGDWVKTILPLASSTACIITFLVALTKGKFSRLDRYDSIALVIGCIAGFVWFHYQSATYANLILQFAVAVSFTPMYRKVWQNPKAEKWPPWLIWSTAYFCSLAVIYLRWQPGHATDLVYPINCLILHAAVIPLTWRKQP